MCQEIPTRRQADDVRRMKPFGQRLLQTLGLRLDHEHWPGESTVVINETIERDSIIVALACPSKAIADNCNELRVKTRHRNQTARKIVVEVGFRFEHQKPVLCDR